MRMENNSINQASFFVIAANIFLLFSYFPIVSMALTHLNINLVTSKSHKWPTQGLQTLFSFLSFIAGYLWQIISQSPMVHLSLIIIFCISIAFIWTFPNLVVQIFLKAICEQSPQSDSIFSKSKLIISNFENVQNAFSSYFLIFFSSTQFMIIFQIFLTYQYVHYLLEYVLNAVGCIVLQIFAMILSLMAITKSVEEASEVVRNLRREIQIQILKTNDDVKLKQLEYWKNEAEMLKPMNAAGYFEIDKTTLTSMLSVSLTYIIILVQFSPDPDGIESYNASNLTEIINSTEINFTN